MKTSRLVVIFSLALVVAAAGHGLFASQPSLATAPPKTFLPLQPNTLCTKQERVIFACRLKRPAKIVSICASKDLTSETGYLQYRFGVPGKIELEFPRDRQGTQQKFEYTHYFRARFELNDINFSLDGVDYSVFNDYNGEEKREVTLQGVSINQTGKREVRYNCGTKPKADYTDLQAALSSH